MTTDAGNPSTARPEDPTLEPIERIGTAVAAGLKAERVQLRLQEIPGWLYDPAADEIRRTVDLGGVDAALTYACLVVELATGTGRTPEITLRGGRLTLALGGSAGGGLAADDLDLARRLAFPAVVA